MQKPLAEAELSGAVQGTQLAQDAAAGAAQPMQSDRDGWLDELAYSSQLTEEEKKAALPPGVQSQLRSQAQPLRGVSVSEEPSFTVTQSQNKQSLELLFQTREE